MMQDLLLASGMLLSAILAGVLCGIVTGITPGVHINLVSAILLAFAPAIALYIPLLLVCVLIMTMAVTHAFLDTIPSIFLGAPDDDKALGVLPGHRYLLRGNGLMAVKLCVVGGIIGTFAAVALFVPFSMLLKVAFESSKPYLFWVILAMTLFTVLKDKKKAWAAAVFMLSGLLGLVTLHLPLSEPLFPLLSGMFGVATLLYSINEHQRMPPQKDLCYTELDWRKTAQGGALGVAGGFLTALLPGVSASAASAVVSRGSKLGDHGFLVLLGALGSAGFILALASFLSIAKARHGAMVVITTLSAMDTPAVVVLLSVALVATGIASLLALWMGRRAARWLPRIPYRKTCIAVIVFVVTIVFLRTGWLGLLVLLTSTAVGLLPAALKTARAQAMGCLLLPILVMLW